MNPIAVPPPQLSWAPLHAPSLEEAIEVRVPVIRYGDGREAIEADARHIGAYVLRLGSGAEEIWNEAEQRWAPVPTDPSELPPLPLAYKAGESRPWQGLLAAADQKDKDGNDRFQIAAGGAPRYRLRAYGRFRRDGEDYAGLSDPSDDFAFAAVAEPPVLPINVPTPQLIIEPPGLPQLEQPVEVRLPPIRYSDGTEALEADAQKLGAFVYRLRSGVEEIWNEAEKRWMAVPADPSELQPVPLAYKKDDPRPWQGMLIAHEQKDKDDNPRFEPAAGGEPRYILRAYARFKRERAEFAGISAPSSALAFVSGADSQRFTVVFEPEQKKPATCEKVRLELRNAGLAKAGYLEIRATGAQEVEIANCDASGSKLAQVLLDGDGSIHLIPALGQRIVLEGDLLAQHIRYQPLGGGGPADL